MASSVICSRREQPDPRIANTVTLRRVSRLWRKGSSLKGAGAPPLLFFPFSVLALSGPLDAEITRAHIAGLNDGDGRLDSSPCCALVWGHFPAGGSRGWVCGVHICVGAVGLSSRRQTAVGLVQVLALSRQFMGPSACRWICTWRGLEYINWQYSVIQLLIRRSDDVIVDRAAKVLCVYDF